MRKIFLPLISALLTVCAAASAQAKDFSFVPHQTGAQKEFQNLLKSGNYQQAWMSWPQAIEPTDFAKTDTGIALHSYLMIQSGYKYLGTEALVIKTRRDRINRELLSNLTPTINEMTAQFPDFIPMNKTWRPYFKIGYVPSHIKSKRQLLSLFHRMERMPKDAINARAEILWVIGTTAPLLNDTKLAVKALKEMKESGQTVIGHDAIDMAMARVLYQSGDLKAALFEYDQIPKSSDLWIESREEKAWAYLRQKNYDKAVAEVTTATSPAFTALEGPEPYYLSNLISLRICNYPKIFKTGKRFKKVFGDKIVELQNLAKNGVNKASSQILSRMDDKGVSLASAGADVAWMPRQFLRDRRFSDAMNYRHHILTEIKSVNNMKDRLSVVGTDELLSNDIHRAGVLSEQARHHAVVRLRKLAKDDLGEFRKVIDKMHIVEAELIERMYVDPSLKGRRNQLAQAKYNSDDLVFPYTKEVWMDELDSYSAQVKNCPSMKGASL